MLDPKKFLRDWIEIYFDNVKKDPEITKQAAMSIFSQLGLEPSVDAVLCYILGICTGLVSAMADLTEDDRDDLTVEIMESVYPKIIELKEIMSD